MAHVVKDKTPYKAPPERKPTAERFVDKWKTFSVQHKAGDTKLEIDESRVLPTLDESEEGRKKHRLFVSKARYRLSKALNEGMVEDALLAAQDLNGCSEQIPNDLLVRLLILSADLPGAVRFAKALSIVAESDLQLSEHDFATVVGKLMSRDAPHAQVRAAFNLGVAQEADIIPLVPLEVDKLVDAKACFVGSELLDEGELSEDDEDAYQKMHPGKAAPKRMGCTGFKLMGKLNGSYVRTESKPELLGNDRPVYMKSGKDGTMYAYYYDLKSDDPEWQPGWYIGSQVGGGGRTHAHCPGDKGWTPAPSTIWKIKFRDGWETDSAGFQKEDNKNKPQAIILDEEEAEEALRSIDLAKLKGRLKGKDEETARYFGHFFVLLHLEHLAEVFSFRHRFRYRRIDELTGFGIAFDNLPIEKLGKPKEESRRMPMPGWASLGAQQVTFLLPKGLDPEKVRFKRAESVLISRGNPIASRISEGSVTEFDLRERRLTVNINGTMTGFDPKARFRIDLYANRTSFERQVTALLQFITMERTRICDMLIAAGVGKVDLAVLGSDGFHADKGNLSADNIKKNADGTDATPGAQGALAENKEENDDDEVWAGGADWSDEEGNAGFEPDASTEADPDLGKAVEKAPEPKPELSLEDAEAQRQLDEMEEIRLAAAEFTEDGKIVEKDVVEFDADGKVETKEESIKRRTLALADEVVDGLDFERLAEAETEVLYLQQVSEAQRNAIQNSMSRRLTIVQGPPGTGKTHTSVKILTMWAKTMRYKPLLATSECNIAVDNIAEGLVKAGVKVCRVGRPEKVREHLEKACLDNMVKIERERRKAEEEEEENSELEELGEEPEEADSEDHEAWWRRRALRFRKIAWERKQDGWMRANFLKEAEVICCTTISSGSQALGDFKFHGILIDEVAQATETSVIVPIVMRGASQLVLCGDHCQLPPSVVSREAELRGFSLSLYSRLVEAGVPFRFLDTQYRAHPMLMEFSAFSIYQGKLLNGIDGSNRPQPKGIPWPDRECPAAFFPSDVAEHLDGESKANEVEAKVVLKLVQDVLAGGELGLDGIGVVTPYKGQVRTLRRVIFAAMPELEKSKDLEVASVDNFQGREKELIIFSAVRCNDFGGVGFLADWRRLNVMITRARRGLVIVGNAATLVCDPHWKLWLEFTQKQGGAVKGTLEAAMAEAEGKGGGKGKGKGKGKGDEAEKKKLKQKKKNTLVDDWDAILGNKKKKISNSSGLAALAKKKQCQQGSEVVEDAWDAVDAALDDENWDIDGVGKATEDVGAASGEQEEWQQQNAAPESETKTPKRKAAVVVKVKKARTE